ncbi:MAG: YigZ family protein [Crocinitomicaceae bacterium]|nr:YigZ family protein [Crocinitomicaceae bacterium]|tara:strand:- start:81439 stop:82047 length:609 start_codon:yes stop_codon:yes gene_type:complete
MVSNFFTLTKESIGLYRDKGSKFIGIVSPCNKEEDALLILKNLKSEYHKAQHFCYSYKFGVDGLIYKTNDDGEPINSAGKPILGQINSFNLTNVIITVIRYYGGTNLGVGGLIKAYREAAKSAIENGDIIPLIVYDWVHLIFSYEDMPFVMNILKKHKLNFTDNSFEEICKLTTFIKINEAEKIKLELKKISSIKIIEKGIY